MSDNGIKAENDHFHNREEGGDDEVGTIPLENWLLSIKYPRSNPPMTAIQVFLTEPS